MIHTAEFPQSGVFSLAPGDNSQMFVAVDTGKADFLVYDSVSAAAYMKNNPGRLRKLGAAPLRTPPVMLPMPHGDYALQQMLNMAITEMRATGELDRIISRYSDTASGLYRLPALYSEP